MSSDQSGQGDEIMRRLRGGEVPDQGELHSSVGHAVSGAVSHAVSGPTPKEIYDSAREVRPPGQIVVRGGEKSRPLPPARELDGTPDPELGRMVREGAKRYHLETLASLDRESRREAERVLVVEGRGEHAAALRTAIQPTLDEIARVCGMAPAPTLSFGDQERTSGGPMQKIDEIERVRLENLGRELARSMIGNEDVSAETGEKLDAVLEKPCGAAACRTLKECLCRCKRCKMACARRRR